MIRIKLYKGGNLLRDFSEVIGMETAWAQWAQLNDYGIVIEAL